MTPRAKGYPLSDGPHASSSGRIAFIDAPEGYEIELIERGAKSVHKRSMRLREQDFIANFRAR